MNERRRASLCRTAAALLAVSVLTAACSAPVAHAPLEGARIGAPFALTDQDGHVRTDRDFAGRYRIVYFGYTFCPDVCPIDMQVLAGGLRAFEARDAARGARVVPIFITVDPARDTPKVLKAYVAAFHPRMVGLTGNSTQIAAVAKAYGVPFSAEPPTADGGYIVAHGRSAYLMDPDGKPLALLPQDKTPADVAAELDRWVR